MFKHRGSIVFRLARNNGMGRRPSNARFANTYSKLLIINNIIPVV